MVTFGFTLLVTDVAIMIMTYYSVIGGWITEYLAVYLAGQGVYAAEEGYFTSFITSEVYPIIFMLLFSILYHLDGRTWETFQKEIAAN